MITILLVSFIKGKQKTLHVFYANRLALCFDWQLEGNRFCRGGGGEGGKNKVRSLILMQANRAVLSIPELSSLRGQNSPMVLESRMIERS